VNQIDVLVPYELPTSGTVDVQVVTPAGTSPTYTLNMVPAVPTLFYLVDPSTKGRLNVIAEFANTAWLAMPTSMAAALKIPTDCMANDINAASICGQPAVAGDYLALYATGLGKATPNGDPNGTQLTTGQLPPADGSVLYETVVTPTITVGGLPATVLFSGLTPGASGLYQINFQVPAGITGDNIPVNISMPGTAVNSEIISIQTAH
jgi:uncharacterized protein (TIGR03437 family)